MKSRRVLKRRQLCRLLPLSPAALSKIRHDLKTPLNHIIGYGEMLLEDAEAAGRGDAEGALRRLLDSAQACLDVQRRLLTREPEELKAEHFQGVEGRSDRSQRLYGRDPRGTAGGA